MEEYTVKFTDNALSAATAKTVALLATPSTRRLKVKEVSVSFDGVTAANTPVLIELARYTADGTGTAYTPVKNDPAAPAALCSAKVNYSAEPTIDTANVVANWRITPNGGAYTEQLPLGDEPMCAVSSWIGIRATAAQTVNISGYIKFIE